VLKPPVINPAVLPDAKQSQATARASMIRESGTLLRSRMQTQIDGHPPVDECRRMFREAVWFGCSAGGTQRANAS